MSVATRLGNALELVGFEVCIVTRGAEVIRYVARSAPDVLVCDTDLPDADALQLARRLRRQAAPFPVVLLADGLNEFETGVAERPTNVVTAPPLIPAPCDEQRLVDLICDLVSDVRSTASGYSAFPTRVIWPTAHRRTALVTR